MTSTIIGPQLGVAEDLLVALQDIELTDVTLVGHDGVEVPSCRFLLAARSKVFKRMLYGGFREAKLADQKIELLEHSGRVLTLVVKFCSRGQCFHLDDQTIAQQTKVSPGQQQGPFTDSFLRSVVQVNKAADYFEIPGLVQETESLVRKLISKFPLLACSVFDEADEDSAMFDSAKRIIQCRPYVSLLPSSGTGGIECLKSDKVVAIMKDKEIEAGELFLFTMLQRWLNHVPESHRDEARSVAKECGAYLQLSYIEPNALLATVEKAGILPRDLIMEAFKQQALKASRDRVWTIDCRGKNATDKDGTSGKDSKLVDRVLVEGCGHNDVNGIYYKVRGLQNGDVYSKKEVSCGQLNVYTLSCSQKGDTIESRIFCSKVVTHRGITSIHAQRQSAAAEALNLSMPFQPVLQVIALEAPTNHGIHERTPLVDNWKIQLSDGDHYIGGTLDLALSRMAMNKQIQQNTLVKILSHKIYEWEGKQQIHVVDLSLVAAHPGHRLGNPVEFDEASFSGSNDGDGFQKLYSCYYPLEQQAKDSRIPRTGWQLEDHGSEPAPTCSWIPATTKSFGDISPCYSLDEDDEATGAR